VRQAWEVTSHGGSEGLQACSESICLSVPLEFFLRAMTDEAIMASQQGPASAGARGTMMPLLETIGEPFQ
jgi:hypothetical protein